MLEAVIYTRFSKVAGSRSTGEQEAESRKWCDSHDHPVDRVFTDNISASRFSARDRPEWGACKKYLRKGHILVVWEASRAHRDLEEFVELRNLCASLQVPFSYNGKVLDLTLGDDRFTAGLDALLAERESEQISLRVLRSKRTAAASGLPGGGPPPWGYRQRIDPDSGRPVSKAWEIDPVEGPRVREAIRRLLQGDSQRSILKWLNETEGRHFSHVTTLQRGLTRPAIAGLRVHHGEIVAKGTWKPIISEELHQQVIDMVAEQKRMYGHVSQPGPEPKYLLGGIAKCGLCGAGLEYKGSGRRRRVYSCPRGHVSRAADLLEKAVEEEILELAAGFDPSMFEDGSPEVMEARAEMKLIKADYATYKEAAGRREISPQAFMQIEKDLLASMRALEPKTRARARFGKVDFDTLQKRWPTATVRERREAIRAFLTIEVHPREVGTISNCEHVDRPAYARGVCHPCYQRARTGAMPMPPLTDRGSDRVLIETIFDLPHDDDGGAAELAVLLNPGVTAGEGENRSADAGESPDEKSAF